MPLFFASNALYPVSVMPVWLQVLSRFNPLTYLVDGLRNLLLYPQPAGIVIDMAVLLFSTLCVWSVCSVLYPRLLR
jgi:ABC-2 type transport system permease protein